MRVLRFEFKSSQEVWEGIFVFYAFISSLFYIMWLLWNENLHGGEWTYMYLWES